MERNENGVFYVEILKGRSNQWYGCMVGEVFKVEERGEYSATFKVIYFTERQKRIFHNSYGIDFDEERLANANGIYYGIKKEDCIKDTFKTKIVSAILRGKNDKK